MMVCEQLQKARKLDGNYVVGFIDVGETMLVDREKVVGSLSDIETIIHRFHVTELYVAVEKTNEHHLFELINQLIVFQVSIKLLPSSFHFLTSRVKMNQFSISPYIDVTALSMSDWEICTKRFLDVVMSLLVLSLFAPFFLYLYIRVKMSASGSALYFQERIGLHGKPFKIIKFRTMYPDAENGTPQLTTLNDERITPFGNTLRRYRLDELPQFINILKGEMSIVGPRPERKYFIDQIMKKAPYYCLLYNVRPGLTSWGPIKVGYTHSIDKMIDRLNNDIVYLENMSLLSDMQILFYTISILIKGKGI
jgi:exopolysaccharide biosynthesis polyprenyl glycosylphosphotransferase